MKSTFPDTLFHIDCNSGYTLEDIDFFKSIDAMGLAFIEQPLSNEDILEYIKAYSPYVKAGSYGIQDFFSVHVNKINGCFYNVMGFPLSSFYYQFSKIIK